jgi:hypothetical protein
VRNGASQNKKKVRLFGNETWIHSRICVNDDGKLLVMAMSARAVFLLQGIVMVMFMPSHLVHRGNPRFDLV